MSRFTNISFIGLATASILLSACSVIDSTKQPAGVTILEPKSGSKVSGSASFTPLGGDLTKVEIRASGLKPNALHGFHIHEKGDCSADDATSAGGHFNPLGKQHGGTETSERHAGDLPALEANSVGEAQVSLAVKGISLEGGPTNVIGKALIIHRDPDDYKTQPTGNSGARIACGVIKSSK